MPAPKRYRVEDGRLCIDMRMKSVRQLYDLRDPAPFRERDLDPGAVEYLMTSIREIPIRKPVRIVLLIGREEGDPHVEPPVLEAAIRAHFGHERELVERSIRESFRHGRKLFVIGLGVLAVFLMLSKMTERLLEPLRHAGEILKEGFVITGWVAMWRPAEALLYDWVPLYEERRWIDKLLASEIQVRTARSSVLPMQVPPAAAAP